MEGGWGSSAEAVAGAVGGEVLRWLVADGDVASVGRLACTCRAYAAEVRVQRSPGGLLAVREGLALGGSGTSCVEFFSRPGCSMAASADGYRGEVAVTDLVSGSTVAVLGPAPDVCALAWSADGRRLATGTWDGTVKVFQVGSDVLRKTGKAERVLVVAHRSGWWVEAGCWSPAEDVLALGTCDGAVELVCGRSGESRGTLEGHGGRVRAVAWTLDGARLATGADDGSIKVWDKGVCSATLDGAVASSWISSLAWDKTGRRVVAGGGDGSVRVWDMEGGREEAMLRPSRADARVTRVRWGLDARRIAVTLSDHSVLVWIQDKDGGAWSPSVDKSLERVALGTAWSPDGSGILIALARGQHVVSAVRPCAPGPAAA